MSMIIGLCGFQGSGKDTVGDILVKSHGFIRLSFASALKDAVAVLFGWNRDMLEGVTPESRQFREQIDEYWSEKLKIPDFTPRKALQMIGTELFRNHFHSNMWVDIVENKINQLIKSNPQVRIVICDFRFDNEVAMIKKFSGSQIIHVRRNIPEWFEDFRSGSKSNPLISTLHPSEIEWMGWEFDRELSNSGSLDDLEEQVLHIAENKSMDFTCIVPSRYCVQIKKILERNQDWNSYYKIRTYVTKYSQTISRLTKSKISENDLGYYKTLVYNDWTNENRMAHFKPEYRSQICSMLNAIKNKQIEERVKL